MRRHEDLSENTAVLKFGLNVSWHVHDIIDNVLHKRIYSHGINGKLVVYIGDFTFEVRTQAMLLINRTRGNFYDYKKYWLILLCNNGERSCTNSVIWRCSWLSYHAIPCEVFVYVTLLRQETSLISDNCPIISVCYIFWERANLSQILSLECGKLYMTTQFVYKHKKKGNYTNG